MVDLVCSLVFTAVQIRYG